MARTKKSVLRPAVIFLIGIILIALSFALWYYIVTPVVGLSTYSIEPPSGSKTISNASSLILYFGSVYVNPAPVYNRSRPVDNSFTLSINVAANTGGPISVTAYLRGNPVFSAKTNATDRTIWCNSTLAASNKTTPGIIVYPNIEHAISVSLLDAFTGGTTPYVVIQNLNSTAPTSVTYSYHYIASSRSSDGLPIAIFIVGVIIAVIEGIVLLRFAIAQVRER